MMTIEQRMSKLELRRRRKSLLVVVMTTTTTTHMMKKYYTRYFVSACYVADRSIISAISLMSITSISRSVLVEPRGRDRDDSL